MKRVQNRRDYLNQDDPKFQEKIRKRRRKTEDEDVKSSDKKRNKKR